MGRHRNGKRVMASLNEESEDSEADRMEEERYASTYQFAAMGTAGHGADSPGIQGGLSQFRLSMLGRRGRDSFAPGICINTFPPYSLHSTPFVVGSDGLVTACFM